ncbi:MAG: hypothetical protein HN341_04895 [Verrucomicrobia bacterium]|nr:hypothetical protein [Verrucomicrobiota bacterium]
MSAKKKTHQRATGQTSVTFSCSEDLKDRIATVSAKEGRSMANWIRLQVEAALESPVFAAVSTPSLKKVAETRATYSTAKRDTGSTRKRR